MSLAPVLIDFPTRPEGRPSNAALSLENRTLRAAIADLTEERDELAEELAAFVSERIAAATESVRLARRAQRFVAAGWSPTQHLLDIEALGLREQRRALSMLPGPEAA